VMGSLVLPIVVSTVAVFIASFLSWMVLGLHREDWVKLEKEEEFLKAARECGVGRGGYMFPGWNTPEEMKSEDYKRKCEAGPCGVMTVFPKVSMPRNLGLTLVYFLGVNFCLAYLATLAIPAGASFMTVFRFVTTAGFMTFLAAIVQHAIWFHCRIVGHVIESVAYAVIVGVIFAAMWPGA